LQRDLLGAYSEAVYSRGADTVNISMRLDYADETFTRLSPRLGWRRGLGRQLAMRISAGRAFKLPSFFAVAAPPALGGNPDLRPETATSYEAGLEWRSVEQKLALRTTAYYSDFRDLVDFDFQQFLHVNRGSVRARGFETELEATLAPALQLFLNVNFQDVDSKDGAELRHRPDWYGNGRLIYRFRQQLHIQLDATSRGDMHDQQIPVTDRFNVAGTTLLGTSLIWRAGQTRLTLRAENLTSRDYETLIGFPGPGRHVRLEARWRR
jgi:outer membrane receptor protein involved in Fe transport